MNLINRFKEPSSWAGLGLLCQGLAGVIASKGQDSQALATVIGGVLAVVMPERKGGA